jgi:hypothetical protein
MTSRHETLTPLTHDHHHALAQARRLHDVSKMADITERRNRANDFLNFYFGRAIRHFHEKRSCSLHRWWMTLGLVISSCAPWLTTCVSMPWSG